MRRRLQQQLLRRQYEEIPYPTSQAITLTNTVQDKELEIPPVTTTPFTHVPNEVIEQAQKIRQALKSGKAFCEDCLSIFEKKAGLNIHKKRWCKGK